MDPRDFIPYEKREQIGAGNYTIYFLNIFIYVLQRRQNKIVLIIV